MPGPWIHLKDNLDFYNNLEVAKGSYLETYLYDNGHELQGNGIWRVVKSDERRRDGLWLEAKLIAASDSHLNWWMSEGPGKDHARRYQLHLCTGEERTCRKTKRKPSTEFHSDYFRLLDTGDLNDKTVQWVKADPAKGDLADELARLGGVAPRGSARKKGSGDPKKAEGALKWSGSEGEEIVSGDEDAGQVAKRLKELKGELAHEDKKKKEEKDRKEKKTKKKAKGKKKEKKEKEKEESSSSTSTKKHTMWFGEARPRKDKKRKPSSSSTSSTDGSAKSSGKNKKDEKASKKKAQKSKKRKVQDAADRGPFGVGSKQHYGERGGSSDSEGSLKESEESVFRAGLSSKSHHLQLEEYAQKRPGRLASRLLVKMDNILSRQESPLHQKSGRNMTPSTGTAYFLTVVVPQYRDRLPLRASRELRTIAKALDLVAQGEAARAADVLAQRYKALEMSLSDQNWSRAQHVELIPPDGAVLTEHDELVMATKEQTSELKMRQLMGMPLWRGAPRGEVRTDEKGRPKGKGKGKKGQKSNHHPAGEGDKPPPA
eukprot:Skav206769  [mRNA]  locus=scaffold167:516646:518277:+ [translate_table: standard]